MSDGVAEPAPDDHERRLEAIRRQVSHVHPDGRTSASAVRDRLRALCAVARADPAAGASISLMTDRGGFGPVASSDSVADSLDALQFAVGEGPSIAAFEWRRPVLVSDLSAGVARQWPGFTRAAAALGVGAVFAFPLQVGAARLGALTLLRRAPGELSRTSAGLALAVADVAVEILVDGQGAVGPGGETVEPDGLLRGQYLVYQAQGMTMVDLHVTLVEALARLRAFAFAQDRSVEDVARDIVEGRLRLDREMP